MPLLERLDAYRTKMALPGVTLTRSDAVRTLLEQALTTAGFPPADDHKGKRSK